jgi:flagellar hook-associated protein 3 FlgL
MITRVTNQTMMQAAARNLQANAVRLSKLQDEASSQKMLNRPSDDPQATAQSLSIHAEQRANSLYSRNIADANAWLTTIDSTLGTATDIMRQVRDLTVQGANDSLSPAGREAIATQLDSLKAELLTQANTTYAGRKVFAGNSDAPVAVDATSYEFTGAPGSTVQRRLNADTTVRVDVDGAAAFGNGISVPPADTDSVFALIDSISADLRGGVNVSARLDAVDSRINAMIQQRTTAGSVQAQVQRAGEANMDKSLSLETQRSGIEDTDLGQAVLNLQMQQVAYQTTLAVTAKVLQPTLMDFLQ